MTFLKKLGIYLAKGAGIVLGFGPVLSGILPDKAQQQISRIGDTLEKIAGVVVTAETMVGAVQGADGLAKLNAASPFVEQLIRQSEIMAHREIADEAKFAQAVRTITGGVADLLNSLKDKGLKVEK